MTSCAVRLAALKPGQVTDDTTMSLALGASILAQGKVDALAAAQAFDAWMRAKPVDIGNTVRRNLLQFRNTGNPEAPYSDHDAGNGAAMRVLPVALATFGQAKEPCAPPAAHRPTSPITAHSPMLLRMPRVHGAGCAAWCGQERPAA